MIAIKSALSLGFFDWLLPFAISFAIFTLKGSSYYLFESVMAVVIVLAVIFFSARYFKKVAVNSVKGGFLLGILWLVINLAMDLVLFLPQSPMQMPLSLYMSQIGIKYLCIPLVTAGFGYLKK